MLALLVALTLTSPRITQPAAAAAASSGSGYNLVQEDGTPLTQRTTLNFTGTSITCSDSGGITVCAVSAGAPGSANFTDDTATFTGGSDILKTVTAAWATGASQILCSANSEEGSVEGMHVTVTSRAVGSFVVRAYVDQGCHTGAITFTCTGN